MKKRLINLLAVFFGLSVWLGIPMLLLLTPIKCNDELFVVAFVWGTVGMPLGLRCWLFVKEKYQ
jgi:hypothetical protein